MLGVGPAEIFVLAVVALVIFGPGKLPEVAGQVGRAVRDFRRMTADLTGEFERTIAEVDDIKESVRKEVGGMRAEVEGVSKSVKKDLESISETSGGAKPAQPKKATAGKGAGGRTAAKPTANGAAPASVPSEPMPIATKADPLADVSLLDDEPVVASSSGPIPAEATGTKAGARTDAAGVEASGEAAPAVAAANVDEPAAAGEAGSANGVEGAGEAADAPAGSNGAAQERPELAAVVGGEPDDALIRARRRRAEAGYRRRA